MTDPKPLGKTQAGPAGTEKDSRVDRLLVEGLDRYFLGQHEEAIHIWTRVLFLDRSHASARAYIERARGAIAERQRRAEEALHQVGALLGQGRAHEARERLRDATRILGEDERTAALRHKVERLERAAGGRPRIRAAEEPSAQRWTVWVAERLTLRTWMAAAALVVASVALTSSGLWARLGVGSTSVAPAQTSVPGVIPVLAGGEVALVRARSLYARGRLSEALVVLESSDALSTYEPEQPTRVAADTLRVEIQRLLLSAVGEEGRQGPR